MTLTFNAGTQLKTYDSKTRTKKCSNPLCGKIYNVSNFYCTCFGTNPYNNKNISDLSISGFLPHLPYGWSRSVTNLNSLLVILEEIYEAESLYLKDNVKIKNHIFQSFLQKGFVTVDPEKINNTKYIKSGPERRVSEYLLNLQVLHLIDAFYNLTPLGHLLVKTKNTMVLFLSFYLLNIKNKFLKDSIYSNFNVNHFKFIFEILMQEKTCHLEELIFLLMAQNNSDYEKIHLIFFKNTTNKKLRKNLIESYFLGKNNKEMSRQKGAIFNLLVSAGILNFDLNSKLYSLTKETDNCLSFLHQNNDSIEQLITDLSIESNYDNKTMLTRLIEIFKVTLNNNKPIINQLIYKSGGAHEENMLKLFSKSHVDFRKYDKSFTHIQLPANVISSLIGGTEYNPDHLCTIKSRSILVDSKSSNSIHNEIHKVIAYNIYAQEAKTKAFIFLDDLLPNKSISIFKHLLLENSTQLENVSLFTKLAIDILCKNNLVKSIFENIFNLNKFLLVCSRLDKNFIKLDKQFSNNLYIVD